MEKYIGVIHCTLYCIHTFKSADMDCVFAKTSNTTHRWRSMVGPKKKLKTKLNDLYEKEKYHNWG